MRLSVYHGETITCCLGVAFSLPRRCIGALSHRSRIPVYQGFRRNNEYVICGICAGCAQYVYYLDFWGSRGRWFESSRPDQILAGRRVYPPTFFLCCTSCCLGVASDVAFTAVQLRFHCVDTAWPLFPTASRRAHVMPYSQVDDGALFSGLLLCPICTDSRVSEWSRGGDSRECPSFTQTTDCAI